MTSCVTPDMRRHDHPGKCHCPVNGKEYRCVAVDTIRQHLDEPWNIPLPVQGYYFCTDPQCRVVYFGEDGVTFDRQALRTRVGQKSDEQDRIVCYCFGVSEEQLQRDKSIRNFIIEQTKNSTCACASRNPSGRCCLADIPR